jgi:hypothetical protein
MKDIITYSMKAVKDTLKATKSCFELFGYDFIVDGDGKAFLIEINTNPSLEESSKFLKVILNRMINDMFRITIDQMFPLTKEHTRLINEDRDNNRKWSKDSGPFRPKVHGYSDDENLWEELPGIKINLHSNEELHNPEAFEQQKSNYHSR